MKNGAAVSVLLFGLAACGGPGGMSPSGGLMYRVPDPANAVYVTQSSSTVSIDAGAMGSFSMEGKSEATISMSFAQSQSGVEVTAGIQKLSASLSQPMGGSQSASEADLQGDLVFDLDRTGKGTVVSLPEMKGAAESLANPINFVHGFFPRLPGRAVHPGDMWTDTIQYDVETSQGKQSTSTVLTYTLQGDTTVAGKRLLRIVYDGRADLEGSGMQQGMDVYQTLSGGVEGTVLWDPERGLMISDETSQDLTGTVEVPAAGIPAMPMAMKGTSSTRLQNG